MIAVSVQITRYVDTRFPGWVECVLVDASGREWVFTEKAPIFTHANLHAQSSYPQPGVIACEIVREWSDEHGHRRCMISTERPRGIAAMGGEVLFEVSPDQIKTLPISAE